MVKYLYLLYLNVIDSGFLQIFNSSRFKCNYVNDQIFLRETLHYMGMSPKVVSK